MSAERRHCTRTRTRRQPRPPAPIALLSRLHLRGMKRVTRTKSATACATSPRSAVAAISASNRAQRSGTRGRRLRPQHPGRQHARRLRRTRVNPLRRDRIILEETHESVCMDALKPRNRSRFPPFSSTEQNSFSSKTSTNTNTFRDGRGSVKREACGTQPAMRDQQEPCCCRAMTLKGRRGAIISRICAAQKKHVLECV